MAHHAVQQSIADVILSAIPAAKIRPGTRPGESEGAQMRGVSRTRGRFAIEPSVEEVRDTCRGRRVVEVGLLHAITEIPPMPPARSERMAGRNARPLHRAGSLGPHGSWTITSGLSKPLWISP